MKAHGFLDGWEEPLIQVAVMFISAGIIILVKN